jgi:hypothetical protein
LGFFPIFHIFSIFNLGFLLYVPYLFTIEFTFLLYFPNLFTFRLAFHPYFFQYTSLTSNKTNFFTMVVASTGFSKSLVISVMLCPAHRWMR